jgi:N-acetylglucosaminyl-diphospho-decaprenol L-rhamnosyltransferase
MILSISVVSSRHGALVRRMLESLAAHPPGVSFEVILTINAEEPPFHEDLGVSFPLTVLRNERRKGFAANHNQAFKHARGRYFCVLNPDIVFVQPVFDRLIELVSRGDIGVVAPGIVDAEGRLEDTFRRVPGPGRIVKRALDRRSTPDVVPIEPSGLARPEWIAGMFLLTTRTLWEKLGGFDERYYLYCEDVDFGIRAREAGFDLVVDTRNIVVHEARRSSRRNLRYLFYHLRSLTKLFLSAPYRRARLETGNDESSRRSVR